MGAVVAAVLVGVAWVLDTDSGGLPPLVTPMVFAVVLVVGQKLLLRRTGLTAMHWSVYVGVFVSPFGMTMIMGVS